MRAAFRWAVGLPLSVLVACTGLGPGVVEPVLLAPADADHIRFLYLGSGGWIIERGEDMVLTGPHFTNPGFLRTGLWTIRADTAEIDRYMRDHDVTRASVILVGHAHYDHLMDVPRVARRHAPAARILGNLTVANTLGTWSGLADRVDVGNDEAGNVERPGQWIEYGEGIRVMPLESHHAAHFDGLTLYQGSRARPLTEEPRTAGEWLDGETIAFLIDFLDDDGTVAYRVYYQDAVAPPPAGLAPESLIAERPVDVAILVPATFDQVDWHPEAFIENLQPERVLLGHWEDFFTPMDRPTRAVVLTDHRHFEDRLVNVFDGQWWRPDRGIEFTFPRRGR